MLSDVCYCAWRKECRDSPHSENDKNMSGKPWMGRVAGLLMSLGEWGASVLFAALEVVVGDGGCGLLDGGVEGTETVGDAQTEGAARRGADGEIFAVATGGVGYGPEILTGRACEVAGNDSDGQAVILEETAGENHFIPQTRAAWHLGLRVGGADAS